MASKRKVSNPLALAVMALLFERSMHPYEMVSTMRERGKHESVRLRYSSLYSVVGALEREGLISSRETVREGRRPERTVYGITDAGSRGVPHLAARAALRAGQGVHAVRRRALVHRRAPPGRGGRAARGEGAAARRGGRGDEVPPRGGRGAAGAAPPLPDRVRARAGVAGGRARVGPGARRGDPGRDARGYEGVAVLPPRPAAADVGGDDGGRPMR